MASSEDPEDPGAAASTQRWLRRRPMRRSGALASGGPIKMFGRYRVVGELGRGGMGTVYKAVDTDSGHFVALKILHETDAKGLRRLNREFRRMADISHRNLVALYELGSAGSQRFLVMEFVPGVDFVSGLRPDGVLCPPERLREAIRDLTLGVHALHEHGRVHRDLKPSNVMISDEGRVVVLDFGLVNEIHRKTTQTSSIGAGTPEYMAPEQAAGQMATTASDWYAVGVMLYQVVTGVLPFGGRMIQQMLDKQLRDPAPPSFHVPTVQPELDGLIQGLLAREPANRPSAQDLIAWCDGRMRTTTRRHPTPAPLPRSMLIGLDGQRRALEEAYYHVVRRRQPVMVDVFGPSGTGKTTLVQMFLADARRREATVVLEGRCFAQESVDYKAFDSLMDSLATYLQKLPQTELESLLDDSFAALTQIFPVLGQVKTAMVSAPAGSRIDAALGVDAVQAEIRRRLNLTSASQSDPLVSRARGLRGLKLLLYRLALRARLILVIDDLQWGDADSAQLLADLMALPSPPPLLFIGLWRSEDAGRSHLLRALAVQRSLAPPSGDLVTVETGPLDADDAVRLAVQRLGRTDAGAQSVARRIARESAGNPMLIEALAHHLDPQTDLEQFISQDGRAVSLEQLVQRRLRSLSPEAQRLLELIAVAGQPMAQDVLMHATGLTGDLRPTLGQLRAERLIRTSIRDASSVEVYHDRIRGAVVHSLARHELAERHHDLAEGLLAIRSDDLERLARHLFAAGERERAAEFAADAAYAAERTLAFEHAAALYQLASACRPQDWILKRKTADVLMLAGRPRKAGSLYIAAAEQAPASAAHRILRNAAESLLIAGRLEQARATLRPLLAAIGAPYPEQEALANSQLVAQLDALVVRGVEFVERSEPQLASRDLAAIDTCWCAGKGLMIADPVRGGYYALRAAGLALDAGEPRRIIRCLALAATVAAARASPAAQLWLQAAEQIAAQIKDPEALGFVAVHAGVIHRSHGSWHEAFEALDEGLHQLIERGQPATWERSFAVTSLFTALEALGEIRRLATETSRLARLAQETGDRHTAVMASIYGALVQLARDDPGGARERLKLSFDEWPGETFEVHLLHMLKIQVDCELYTGDAAGAWRRVLDVWSTLEQAGFSRLPVRRIVAFHLRARAALAVLAQDSVANQHLVDIIRADTKQIGREPMAQAKPLEALLDASYHAIMGDSEAVLRRLTAAIHGFDITGMSLLATVARRGKGQWMPGNEGEELVRQTEAFIRMQDITDPRCWAAMVAPGLHRAPSSADSDTS